MGMIGIGDANTSPSTGSMLSLETISVMTDEQAYNLVNSVTSSEWDTLTPSNQEFVSLKAQNYALLGSKEGSGTPATTIPTQTKWLLAIAAGFVLIVMIRR